MKCSMKYFFQIAFCLSIVLTLNSQAAATRESAFLDVNGLLQTPSIRKIISGAVQGAYPSTSTLHSFGDRPLDLSRLQTILPAREAIGYQSTIWPKINSKGIILSEFIAGQTVVYISFPTSSEKEYRELDTSKTWCPRDATHVSQPSSRFLAGFFEGAPGDPTQYELNYAHTVLALYLQNAIWDIITRLISVTEGNYNFVVTGHGPGGGVAQIFSLLLAQRIQEMKINGVVNVIACGSPRAFKYHAGEYVRNRLGPNHIRVFASRKDGVSDSLTSYPATLFSGSTEAVGPFNWEANDGPHALAKANNVWTHPVNPTTLPVELSLAEGLKGTGLSSVGVYAKALSTYVPSVVPVDTVKAAILSSTASAHGEVMTTVLAPPAAGGAGGGRGASASAITEYKTTPPATGGAGSFSDAPEHKPAPPAAAAGAGDNGGGAATSESGGWSGWLPSWLAAAPPPASPAVSLPPHRSPTASASGGAGHVGSAAAGAGRDEDGEASASPGMIAAATSLLGSYVPPAVKDRFAAAAEAVASGVEVAAAVGGKVLEEFARETGKVVYIRSLADQAQIFENNYGTFQNALQHNEDAFRILHRFINEDPVAKGYVAICLAFGFGTHVNLKLAEEYANEVEATIAKPAFLDVPDAQILHGLMLETGLGTKSKYPDLKTRQLAARKLYDRVVTKKPAEAYFRLGELARAESDLKTAQELLEVAAGTYNHPGALNSLGELYYLARKTEDACKRFKLAIKFGNSAAARYNLGRLYYEQPLEGMSPLERKSAAKENLQEAVKLGQISAHTLLGSILYEEGDYAGALSHFTKATVITSSPSTSGFFNIFKSMETAAAEANFMLYLMYKTNHASDSRVPNDVKALEHLKAAEALMHEDASSLSSRDCDLVTLVKKTEIFYKLAMKYYNGATVPLDLVGADIFFSEAAANSPTGAGRATLTPAAKLSFAKAAFASAVVKLEMLVAPAAVAPTSHTLAGAAGGASARATTVTSSKSIGPMSGSMGAGAGSPPTAGLSPGTVITSMASFMATPPAGAVIKPAGIGIAASPSMAAPRDVPAAIQKLLEDAEASGCGEATILLARLRTEGVEKVARSIYIKRHPRAGETVRIDPFEAAAK